MFEGVIANENNCVKAFKDHADLWSRVPAVVAACRKVRLLVSVSTASAHSIQKCCTVVAVKGVLRSIVVEWHWRHIDVGRLNATFSMSFKVGEVTGLVSNDCSLIESSYLLLHRIL